MLKLVRMCIFLDLLSSCVLFSKVLQQDDIDILKANATVVC